MEIFVCIYGLYIQYGSNADVYRAHIAAIKELKSTITEHVFLIICGDFNMSGIKWNENDSGFDFIPIIGQLISLYY